MPIAEFALDDLRAGTLAEAFNRGAVAAMIHGGDRLASLWTQLVTRSPERLPWEATLAEIASNHHGGGGITGSIGDVFYFRRDSHGHVARKVELLREPGSGALSMRPAGFHQDGGLVGPSPESLDQCWSLGETVMGALIPAGKAVPGFRVAVQRLKYRTDYAELVQHVTLIENSLGRWGRLGQAVDAERGRAAGLFRGKGVSDLFGALRMVPLASSLIERANRLATRRDHRALPPTTGKVVESPHIDTRYFSGVCGEREDLRTQVFARKEWVDLPISTDTMAILPGKLAAARLGLRASLHRVIQEGKGGAQSRSDDRDRNVTLLIGAK